MFAWTLESWFRRLVARNCGLHADGEEDRIGVLEPILPPIVSLNRRLTCRDNEKNCNGRVEIYDPEECGTPSWL